jgi:hypothetical protein
MLTLFFVSRESAELRVKSRRRGEELGERENKSKNINTIITDCYVHRLYLCLLQTHHQLQTKNTIVILHRLNQQGQHAHAPNGNNDAGNILEQKHSKAVQQSTSATKSHITRRNQYKACPWMHGFNAGLGRTNPKRTT